MDFDFAWASWGDVGHKAVAVNLSDIAAMGAEPRGLLLSLGLRPTDLLSDVEELVGTFAELGGRLGAPLLGDLSSTDGPLVVSVTAVVGVGHRCFVSLSWAARRADSCNRRAWWCSSGTVSALRGRTFQSKLDSPSAASRTPYRRWPRGG